VHETVEAAREIGLSGLSGVTNAVLRKVADSISDWERRRSELEASDPALALSHPAFLVDRWLSSMSQDEAIALMRANNLPSQVFLRVNTLHVAPEEAVSHLTAEGVGVEMYPEHSLVIGLTRGFGMIEDLPGFLDGWYYVQDPSTLEPVDELAPLPGQRILDLCAAPGGKTTYMAQLMEDTGEIVAVDVDARRLDRLSANCKRLGVSNVRPVLWSPGLEHLHDILGEQGFDGVLVDAPCSNTGVIRRRPEVRWRLNPESWVELVQAQSSLLQTAAEQVRPGGRMVYSTCSVEREENEDRAADFLRHHVHWRKVNSKLVSGWQKGHDSGFYCCFNRD
jgi:16S rRNA (cytosine967-C5)-methyltransferase